MTKVVTICSRLRCAHCDKAILCLLEGEWRGEVDEKLYGAPLFGTEQQARDAGWKEISVVPPALWLCPEHREHEGAVLNAAREALLESVKTLARLPARLEAMFQWSSSEHHRHFTENEIVQINEALLRAAGAWPTDETVPEFWKRWLAGLAGPVNEESS